MAHKILIVEDDDIAGDLSRTLLQDAGFEVELLAESRKALERVRSLRPDLVILDILMPGIDGLSLCRQIKNDPEFSGTKIAIVSAKSFSADRRKAKEFGADVFIPKPYDIEAFAEQIKSVLLPADTAQTPDHSAFTDSPKPVFKVSIWGSRSRSPEPAVNAYPTPCVTVETAGRLLIFDAGTGLAGAQSLLGDYKEAWIFLSHFHQAHVDGLPALSALSDPETTLHFCAASESGASLADLVRRAIKGPSGQSGAVRARMDIYDIRGERYEVFPGLAMTPFYANHPGTTLGFILESEGRKLAYCPDDEIDGERARALRDHDEKIIRLYSEAELVIHDARYSINDYPHFEGSGHSCFMDAVDIAGQSAARRLVLFHQDARYSDVDIAGFSAKAASRALEKGWATQIVSGKAGLQAAV
ncbi:MAG: response regulator [Elusimicrobiota bacterium]